MPAKAGARHADAAELHYQVGTRRHRIDIHVEVPPVHYAELTDQTPAESSSAIRERVNAARARQANR